MRRLPWLVVSSTVAAAALVACVDLFHETPPDDLYCTTNPDASDCGTVEAAAKPPTLVGPVCTSDRAEASRRAERACAWLGACAGPLGENQLGACIVHARLAFDCAANPDFPVRGALRDYWACLYTASFAPNACGEVQRCVAPSGVTNCGSNPLAYTQCESAGGHDPAVRIACAPSSSDVPAAAYESCIASGRTCGSSAMPSCNGAEVGDQCTFARPTCVGGRLHDCDDAGVTDRGIDCRLFGGGSCVAGPFGAACLPLGNAGTDPTCGDGGLACAGATAVGCLSGVPQHVDCAALLGDGGRCDPSAPGPAWDVARACVGPEDACVADSCAGTVLRSCAHGASVAVDCAAVGLGKCQLVSLPTVPERRARCTPP